MENLRAIVEILELVPERRNGICLSHKSVDEEIVRDYAATPRLRTTMARRRCNGCWLVLGAGAPARNARLNSSRLLRNPRYKDAGYLRTEIDYAVSEKTAREDDFAIITLVLSDSREAPKRA